MTVIAVVGGSPAGMAAAARLAKQRHRVLLFEASDRLGGRWAQPGALPPVLSLPAPWRDLFRKSGRAFDVELARTGLALVAAAPAVHRFADGSELTLPTDRGEQWTTLTAAWGTPAATRWRDLLDDLDQRWQLLRRLGLEDEFTEVALTPARRRALGLDRTVEKLARDFGHPQAAALIRSTAWRFGSKPARTPAFVAVRLAIDRTFGRWQLTRDGHPVPASALIDLLADRLTLRGVEVHSGRPVTALAPGRVRTADGDIVVDAIVAAVNPWTYLRLTGTQERVLSRRTAWTRPALAPRITVDQEDSVSSGLEYQAHSHTVIHEIRETVQHSAVGGWVDYRLPSPTGILTVRHDFSDPVPDPGFGTRWTSPRTWLRQPPLRAATPTVVTASASSRGGNDPWAQLLSGALAAYVVHENLTGADIRPTNKAARP
ncbi:MAG TPA: FAD-dependent oxidoreductase [Micropruina sp.]|jgi:phytoene dehydrogenase-like protein|nr:FAD-dependent oxidoreductase [Micropruina sp.]